MLKNYEVIIIKNDRDGVEMPAVSAYFPYAKTREKAVEAVEQFIAPLGETIRKVLRVEEK